MKYFITRFKTFDEFKKTINDLSDYLGTNIPLGVHYFDTIPINNLNRLKLLKIDYHYVNDEKINDNKYIYLNGLNELVTGLCISYEDRIHIKNNYKSIIGKDNIIVSLNTIEDDINGDTSKIVIEPNDIIYNINNLK